MNDEPITRITLETLGSRYVIEHPEDCMDIWEIIESVIRPLLLAAGYHPNNVDEVLGKND